MTTSTCPNREDLLSFALGQLPESQIEWVTDHLEACHGCEATVANLDSNSDTFIDALQSPPTASEFANEGDFERMLDELRIIGRDPDSDTDDKHDHELGAIGEYQLLGELSRGGMATVYRAVHTRMQRAVAIKVLPAHRGANQHLLPRFHREIAAIAKLNHPNLVQAYEAGEADGVNYLVMELVEGIDLHRLVKQLGPLPVADACEIGRQVAAGLEHVREHGLVHRDIKPSNTLLAHDGQVKVADLGLALWEGDAMQQDLTATGQIMGTLDYMAPEQADNSHEVDARADIYSLGCTLFKLLTGRAPFADPHRESPVKKLLAHATTEAPFIRDLRPDIPHDVAELIGSMLAKDPTQRPQSAKEIGQRLKPYADGSDLAGLAARADLDRAIERDAFSEDALAACFRQTADDMPKDVVAGGSRQGDRSWFWAVLTLGIFAIALAGVMIVIRTPHGDLVISSPEDDVRVEVSQGGEVVAIVDTATQESVKLKVGEYGLRLVDESKPLELQLKEFTLRRDQRVVVHVRLEQELRLEQEQGKPAEKLSIPSEAMGDPATARGFETRWSRVISPKTIREQITALRWELPKHFDNPEEFRRGGYKLVRRRTTELAMLFGIVLQYDVEDAFDWSRKQAAVACGTAATVAENCKSVPKPIGNAARHQKLLEILSESATAELDAAAESDGLNVKLNQGNTGWESICDREPLMQRLDELYSKELTSRTSDQKKFAVSQERVQQHAELIAAIATVLHQPSMPESDDDDYRDFAKSLVEHARRLADAGKEGDFPKAKHHMKMISNACSQCHQSYR